MDQPRLQQRIARLQRESVDVFHGVAQVAVRRAAGLRGITRHKLHLVDLHRKRGTWENMIELAALAVDGLVLLVIVVSGVFVAAAHAEHTHHRFAERHHAAVFHKGGKISIFNLCERSFGILRMTDVVVAARGERSLTAIRNITTPKRRAEGQFASQKSVLDWVFRFDDTVVPLDAMLNAIIINGVAVVEVIGVEVNGGVSQFTEIEGIDTMPHVVVVLHLLAAFPLVVIGSVHLDRAVDMNGIAHHRPESRAVAYANDVVGIEGIVGLKHAGDAGIPRVFL